MRGTSDDCFPMFFAINMKDRIAADQPLRPIKAAVDQVLGEPGPVFDQAYAKTGWPSVPLEVLLKVILMQCL